MYIGKTQSVLIVTYGSTSTSVHRNCIFTYQTIRKITFTFVVDSNRTIQILPRWSNWLKGVSLYWSNVETKYIPIRIVQFIQLVSFNCHLPTLTFEKGKVFENPLRNVFTGY